MIIVTLALSLVSASLAFAATSAPQKTESKVWIRPEVFTPVQDDNSFDFSDAGYSVEAYKKASIELIAYVNTGDKERLKSFYQERKKAIEYDDSYTYMYDRIFKLSYISATK